MVSALGSESSGTLNKGLVGLTSRRTVGVIMTIRSELAKAHRRKSLQGALSKEQDEKTSSLMSVFDKVCLGFAYDIAQAGIDRRA